MGILTREVFGLENTDSGFHNLLNDAVNKFDSYDLAVQHFDGQLGIEARGILRALFSIKRNRL